MADRFHIADLFETVAATVPGRAAIVTDAGELTFAELDARASQLAAGLAAEGIGRGDHIGLYLTNCPEYIEAFLAACKLGAVPFNVNYRYREEELAYLFANADAAAIVHGAQYAPLLDGIEGRLPRLRLRVAVEDGSGVATGTSRAYEELAATPAGGGYQRDEQDYLLLYTGGTTGMPKGVMWPHRAFFFGCLNGGGHFHPAGPCQVPSDIAERAANGYQLRMLTIAPLMHGAAIWSALSALLGGLTLVIDRSRSFDPPAIWSLVERHRVNIVQIVGDAMAIPLRDALLANPGRWNLQGVVNFGSGGAVFSAHVKESIAQLLPNAGITDGMGSSESGITGVAQPGPEGMMRLPATEFHQVIVGDRIGAVGEMGLAGRSGNIPLGYYNDAEKSAETFRLVDGVRWSVTGDAGRLDADGMITLFGRGSTCINSGGEKVFPEEIEEVLRAHPAIFDAVVTGKRDERWGERVVAIVALREGQARPEFDELKAFAAERLAGYKVPREVLWSDEIRRSPAGKQDYRWAREFAAQTG